MLFAENYRIRKKHVLHFHSFRLKSVRTFNKRDVIFKTAALLYSKNCRTLIEN